MILNSWLTTLTNRIRNASSRRRLARSDHRNRFSNPAVMQAPPAFGRLSSHIRKAVWQTFDASPRWTSDSRRFQRQVWQTYDVAPLTEALEDRTLLATFTPNVFTDAAINSGNDATEFTLREAVIAANNNAGPDTINLAPGFYQLTIAGDAENASATGDLDITQATTIQSTVVGTNAIIDGGGLDRVFHKVSGLHGGSGSLTLNDLTIQNGSTSSDDDLPGFGGGGISHMEGDLTLNRVVVRNNQVITDSTVDGGGLNVDFDDTQNNFTINILESTFDNNFANDRGGAIYLDPDGFLDGGQFTVNIINTTISNNTAVDDAGGLWVNGGDIQHTVNITNSTISGNTATADLGGGLGAFGLVTWNINNSTIVDNSAGASGGGIDIDTGTLTLNSSIFANNSAPVGPDIFGDDGTVTGNGRVAPGQSPGILNVAGNFEFANGSTYEVEIGGATPGVGNGFHDQIDATGSVTIGTGVTLTTLAFLDGGGTTNFVPSAGESFEIINRTGGSGTFNGLPEGHTFSNFLGSGLDATLTYTGGDGDDVVIEFPTTVVNVAVGNLTVTDLGDLVNTYVLTLINGGADIQIEDTTSPITAGTGATQVNANTVTVPAASVTGSLVFSGSAEVDSLEVDFTNGDPTGGLGLTFNGGDPTTNPGDSLSFSNGTFTTTTYTFDNLNDGNVDIDGVVFNYTGLEPITSTITATNVILNYSAATETITVSPGAAGQTTVDSDVGEITTFNNPSTLLTINPGATGANLIEVEGVGTGFNAGLTITNQSAADTVTFQNGATDIGAGALNVTATTINVNDTAQTTGTITLNATANITDDTTGLLQAPTVDLTAGGTIGSMANFQNTNTADLTTSSGTGSQWINETDGLDNLNLNAGANDVTLVAGGTVEDQANDAVADITGGTATVTVNGGGTFATAGGGLMIDTNVTNLTVTTTDATQWINELSGLSTINLQAGTGNVILIAAGAVADNDGANDITGTSARISASGGIGNALGIDTAVTNLAFANSTGGDVNIDNTGSLTIASVAGLTASSNAAGDVDLTATSPITFSVNTTASGNLSALANDTGGANTDNITVDTGVTVEATTGVVMFEAGDDIIISGGGTVVAGIDLILVSGFDDGGDNDGSITIDGALNANRVVLDVQAQQGATEGGTGSITAPNLLLFSTGTGGFTLDAGTNMVTTISGRTAGGAISYTESNPAGGDIEIGTVFGIDLILVSGFNTGFGGAASGAAVTVNALGGTVIVSQAVSTAPSTGGGVALSGSVDVDAALTAGAGTITLNGNTAAASDLLIDANLTASSTISLSAPRDIIVGANAMATIQTTGVESDINLTADSETVPDGSGGVRIATLGQVNSADAATLRGSDLFASVGPIDSVDIQSDGATAQVTAAGIITLGQSNTMTPLAADLTINGVVTTTVAGGDVRMTANDDIRFGVDGDVSVVDATISILASFNPLTSMPTVRPGQVVMADGAIIDGGTGLVEIAANSDITLGQVMTTGGTDLINIGSVAGAIIDGGDTGGADITGTAVALLSGETPAGGGIGDDADALETQISNLAATTESGDINISDTGGLTLSTIFLTGLFVTITGGPTIAGASIVDTADNNTGADNITVSTNGTLGVGTAVLNGDGGNITLLNTGAAADVTISANVTVTDGDAVIDGDGNVDIDSTQNVLVDSGATISANGGGEVTIDSARLTQVFSSSTIQTADGGIRVTANPTAGAATVDALDVDNSTITSVNGAIVLTGTSGGGGGDGVQLDNAAMILATGNGSISITGDGDADGDDGIDIAGSSVIQVVNGPLMLMGTGGDEADNTNHGIDFYENSEIRSTGTGSITLVGVGGAGTTEQPGVQISDAALMTSVIGDIQIMGTGGTTGDDNIGVIIGDFGVGAVVESTGAAMITITGVGGNGNDSDGVLIATAESQVRSAGGSITITGTSTGTSGDGIEIEAGVTLAINATNAATLSITGTGSGGGDGVQIDSPIMSNTGTVTFQSVDDNIDFGAAGDVTSASGVVTITVDTAGGNSGDLVMADGAVVNAGSGRIDIDADGDIELSSIQTSSALANAVTIDSVTGQVTDGGDGSVDIIANSVGAIVTINAVTGVGDGNALETTVANLDIDNATSGNVEILESDGVNINKIAQATAGDIDLESTTGVVTVVAGQSGVTAAAAGTITIFANGANNGQLAVNEFVTSDTGNITLRADDDVTFAATGDVTSTSGNVEVTADFDNSVDQIGGALIMVDGTVIDAGSGTIALFADQSVVLGSVQTSSAAATAISIESDNLAVADAGDTDIDIVASGGGGVVIRAEDGIGDINALETDINGGTLAALNTSTGRIEIDDVGANTGLLTIGTVDGLAGVRNNASAGGNPETTGFINISNASPISVVDDINANGSITLTTGDTDAINVDNLFIDDLDTGGGDLLIRSTAGSITLNVGDDAEIEGDLTAATIITINMDQPGAGGADAVVLTGGGTLDIQLDEAAGIAADAVLSTTGGTFINGGSQNDVFIFQAQSTTNFIVNGNPPVFGDAGVPPGDTLQLDFTNIVNPPILAVGVPAAGVFSFQAIPAPGDDELSVAYSSIETVDKINGTVNYHLVIDPTLPGSYGNQGADPDDTADELTVRLNPDETSAGGPVAGTDLIVQRDAVAGGNAGDFVGEIFRGTLSDILSLTVQGTDDDETLTIDTTNGLPSFNNAGGFAAVAPSTRGVENSLREIWFDGSFSDTDLNLDGVDLNNIVINDNNLLSRNRGTTSLLEGALTYDGTSADAASFGLTGTTTHAGAWVGAVRIGPAGGPMDPLEVGVVTFGTESNDGSQFWVDLDQNGVFSTTGADGNELIVDNSAGVADRATIENAVGTVDFSAGGLGAGFYNVAITYFTQTDGTEDIEARFAQGNVAYGAATVIDPSAGAQQGLWRSERLDNVHLANADDGNARAEFVFIGRGGTDAVVYNLGSANTESQTYAIGDGLGGGDNSANGNSEGAILTRDDTAMESQLFYFTGLEPITVGGTAGGRLTILGDNEDNLINIEDDGTTAGNTLVTASTPLAGTGVGTYESYSFAANTFANIDVYGMLGSDSIDLIAVDANQNTSMIRLDGDDVGSTDTSNDTIRVRSYPAGNMSSLFGGAGDDTFNIFDANTTVDNILGPMIISGETGTDTVIVNDSLSTTGGANGAGGENVIVNIAGGIPAIEGIFGQGDAVQSVMTDIRISNAAGTAQGSIETLTLSTSADNDDINIDMGGVVTDLTTITINGSAGSDLFNIQSNTPATNAGAAAANTDLNGNADADQFFFEPGSFVLTGSIDGGAGNDALDYSDYDTGRTIQLTALGTVDGFMGNDATAAGASITPVVNDSFDNIDILIGTTGREDTLIGADLRNHFDHGGDVEAFDDAHFNPTGGARTDGGLALVNSLTDSGVLVADEADISLTGNAATIGRPTGANPITPSAGEQDLAFIDFQNYVGAATADDRFDLRDDAVVSGTINGRGGNDTIDYRDWTSTVNVDLNTGTATSVFAGAADGLIVGSGVGNDDNSIENAFGGDAADTIDGDDDDNILGDGFGNDTLHGDSAREGVDPTGIFSGNDTFRLEPRDGDNDIVFDINGSDTIDFSFATAAIVYDADIVGSTAAPFVQDVFNQGNAANVDLRRHEILIAGAPDFIPQPATGNTPFENVIGSQLNDIIDIDPLSISGNFPTAIPVPRFVGGNTPFIGAPPLPGAPIPPGDTLKFDARGAVVQDTGLSITAQGVGTVAYRSIETLASFDDAPRIIDNGDDFVTTVPNTTTLGVNSARWLDATGDGFDNDYLFSAGVGIPGTETPNTTTWTANGVGLGLYRVSITWPDVGVEQNLDSAVPVQVFDGDTLLATIAINQMAAPNDLIDDGAVWEDLGIFDFQTHTARIVLSNETSFNVVADAVRLEQISPGPELRVELQDTGEYVADGVDIVDVTTVLEQQATRTFVITNEGTAPLIIDDIELEQGTGDNWQLDTPSGTAFTLAAGESSFITVTLLSTTANGQGDYPADLRIFSNDFDENVSQLLGQGVNPIPDGDALNDVNPFSIQLNGVVSTVDIIDNGDVRFEEIGVFDDSSTIVGAFGGTALATVTDGDGDRALWTFSDLPDGRYRVSATWASDTSRVLATAEYRVLDSTSILTTQQIDQSNLPVGLNANGTTFQDLGGPFDLTGGTIIVELRDTQLAGATNNSVVIADAIRIERLLDTFADATLFDGGVGGTEIADDTGVVSFGTVLPGAQVLKTFTIRNDGMMDLVVREPINLPDAFTLISFNGAPPTNDTEVTLVPTDTVDFIVQLNAATVGEISGEMSLATGALADGANADPDENPINITLTANVQSTLIVDNLDAANFGTTGTGFQLFNGIQGYDDTVLLAAGDNTPDTATWTFAVDTGSTYRIGATYTAFPNRATDAPYTVSGILGGDQTIDINQQNTPDDRIANGSAFEDLGVFIADGGTITVTLSDDSNGPVIADAIRVEALFGPEIEVLDNTSGTNLQNAASTVDFGDTLQGTALTRTFTITNDGQRALALGPVSLPGEFNLDVAPPLLIPAAVNGVPGSATFTVSLTAVNAGTYGGVLSFATDDADEGPFSFNITGTVIGAATVIDNSDGGPGYTSTGSFSLFSGAGRDNSFQASDAGNGTGTATWSFTGLATGVYNVAATWTGFGNRASEAPYTITDSTGMTSVTIDQTANPDDFTATDGLFTSTWENLGGSFVVNPGDTLTVTLSDLASGFVDADAIRVERIGNQAEIIFRDNANNSIADGSAFDFGNTTPGTPVVQNFTIQSVGDAALVLGALTLPTGFTTTYTPQTLVASTGTLPITITYDGLVDAMGTFSFVTNDDDENPFNITLTGTAAPPSAIIDDNGDGALPVDFAATAGFLSTTGQGFNNDVRFAAGSATETDTATWTFTVAAAGTYRVSSTWFPHTTRATDAPYTISGISGGPLTVDVNQQETPGSFIESGANWLDLETVHLAAPGTITVTLGNMADGAVIADAVRIEQVLVASPEIVVHEGGQVIADGSTVDFGTVGQGGTLAKTFTVVNSGQLDLVVQPPALPPGFTTTFPLTTITPGNTADIIVEVDTSAEAVLTGVLSLASNDGDESPFNLNLTATVEAPAATIIDNVSPDGGGFTSTGFTAFTGQGFDGDVHFSAKGTGADTATWTFSGLAAGQYQVSTTWTPHTSRATDAPYTINGAPAIDINQEAAPNDFQADGVAWEKLGVLTIGAGGSITVVLSDDADDFVIADAVRIDPVVGSEITVLVDGTTEIAQGGTLDFGTIVQGDMTAGTITKTITVRNDGPDNLILQPIPALSGFTISNTNFTVGQIVASGAMVTFDITIDTMTANTLTNVVEFANNDTDESPFNFTATGIISSSSVQILDNGDTGYTAGDFTTFTGQGFGNDVDVDASPNTLAGTAATWTFSNLAPGGVYRVSTTWTPFSNRATDAPYSVTGTTNDGTIDVNQELAPDDLTDQGFAFEDLSIFTLVPAGTTLTVSLGDDADEAVIADAVRIEQITGPEITVFDGATELTDGISAVDFGSTLVGGTLTKVFTVNNVGAMPLQVEPIMVPAGFTVVSDFGVGQMINPGAMAMFEIGVITTGVNAPTGSLSFITNDLDENPFDFNISATVATPAPVIIDNGDAAFSADAGFLPFANQGFQNDVHFAAGDASTDTATWTFVGLQSGTYRVSATWTEHSTRATDAPYTINAGAAIDINQKLAPSDVLSTPAGTVIQDAGSGVFFADLNLTFAHAGGDLTVVLSDSADEFVIADAIRVERTGPLQVVGGQARADDASDPAADLTLDAATNIVTQAADILATTDLTADQADALASVTVDVRDLADGYLGAASANAIYLDINGAGYGWFVDATPLFSEEFTLTDGTLTAIPDGPADGQVDLLTVVLHELGHVIGLEHADSSDDSNDLMSDSLAPGLRRLPAGSSSGSGSTSSLPATSSSLDLTSGNSSSGVLESLLQTPLVGNRTPSELFADRQADEQTRSKTQPSIPRPSTEETNGIDTIFSIQTEDDTLNANINFDEI